MLRVWLLLAITVSVVEAAPYQHVSGVVIDKATGEPVEGALVVGANVSETTSVTGTFTIMLAPDEVEVLVTAPGYAMRVVKLTSTSLRIELESASGAEVIDVEGRLPVQPAAKKYELTSDDLRSLPGTANDVLRAAQALPGVSRLPFSFGGIVLRGTSPRDNAVYLDGIEVPLAFHFGGITSFYPSNMLSGLSVSNGGLEASYGRAQGGIVSLTTREPRRDRWRKGGSIGLLDASAIVEGPFRSGSIAIGLRRSYFDIVAGPVAPDDVPLPSYWDAQVRMSFGDPKKEGGHIAPMAFLSLDDIYASQPGKDPQFEDESSMRAFFVRVAMPYKRELEHQTIEIVPWLGTNQLTFGSVTNGVQEKFTRPVYTAGTRATLSHDYPAGTLRTGLDIQAGHLSRYQAGFGHRGDLISLVNGDTTVNWMDAAIWSDFRFTLAERISLRPGLRLEHYGLTGEAVIDPRLAIQEKLTKELTFRETIGRYHQPPTPGDVDPNGGNPELTSSYVDAASIGIERELPEGWTGSFTGFYNIGRDLGVRTMLDQKNFANLDGLGPTFELLLEKQLGLAFVRSNIGRARSKGLELMIKHSSKTWFGMLSYTLSESERTDDPEIRAGWRPFELDQRHNLNVAASIPLDKWRVGARIHLVSGTPLPAPLTGNLPVFFQLDVRADRKWPQCWGDVNFYADIQNITNRRNVEGRTFDVDSLLIKESRGLPIAPFIGVEMIPN
ncbi:MAG TPA: TonB-dependent receptor [Kofleriaceae bacterium]|nr:TonB-dependent receptor [Kofleriaceae bacterium]